MLDNFRQKNKKHYTSKFNRLFYEQTPLRKQYSVSISRNNVLKQNRNQSKNKKSHERYVKRKKNKKRETEKQKANQMILNKSSITINDNMKLLLLKGLNFAPTPNWTERVENAEWQNLYAHIRRIERSQIYGDSDSDAETNSDPKTLPKKLKIPKTNRPDPKKLNEKTVTYREMVFSKLRGLETHARANYWKKNNLSPLMKNSLQELTELVNAKKIVIICKADKDGKILIIDYEDYKLIMRRELEQFDILNDLNLQNTESKFDKIRVVCNEQLMQLHRINAITDEILFHATGLKYDDRNQKYNKITGTLAKHFSDNSPAYAYPLFKTHKSTEEALKNASITEIPTRLLQSAGSITTSRITAFLELILQPISVAYCNRLINEFCRDSKHYLLELTRWKTTQLPTFDPNNQSLFINAADVKALYPSVNRSLIEDSLMDALNLEAKFNDQAKTIIVKLVMFCLNNTII